MAAKGAMPRHFAQIHPRFLTPSNSTIWMGGLSIVWYIALVSISQNIIFDSIDALGLMILFYYGFTGIACVVYFRRLLFKSVRNAFLIGLVPLAGGLMLLTLFGKEVYDLRTPANSEPEPPGSGSARRS